MTRPQIIDFAHAVNGLPVRSGAADEADLA